MKNIKLLLLCLLSLTAICKGQKKAITETGDEVILYENGTWKYTKEFSEGDSNFIKTDPQSYSKSKNASFLLKANNGNIGFWIDPKKWTFGKSASNADADFELAYKNKSLHGVIISEAAEIPLESYAEIALTNGRLAAPDMKVISREYKTVNGLKVLHLKMEGTQVGMKFNYSAYYYSSPVSSVQFLVASYANTMKTFHRDVEELLNGIVEINPDSVSMIKDITGKNDAISQGSLSPFNNCKKYFEGKWQYSTSGQIVDVERTFEKTFEYTENRKYKFEYINRWLDDCRYEMVFIKTNKPNYKDIELGELIIVEILKIDKKEMKYSTLFRGLDNKGEMMKKY